MPASLQIHGLAIYFIALLCGCFTIVNYVNLEATFPDERQSYFPSPLNNVNLFQGVTQSVPASLSISEKQTPGFSHSNDL